MTAINHMLIYNEVNDNLLPKECGSSKVWIYGERGGASPRALNAGMTKRPEEIKENSSPTSPKASHSGRTTPTSWSAEALLARSSPRIQRRTVMNQSRR
jgi:hypothetical protein